MTLTYSKCLPKAPAGRQDLIEFAERLMELPSGSSVLDLDNPAHLQDPPSAELGIWIDSWDKIVNALGTYDDAKTGIEAARDLLYLASTRLNNMLFSVDGSKPPLDQFEPLGRGIKLLFESSTCYTQVVPIMMYKGRTVYWGSK